VTGLPPGRYSLVGTAIELLPSGQVVTADRHSMAGSSLSMDRAVSTFMRLSGAPLAESLQMATRSPARLLERAELSGCLAVGAPADLIVFRPHTERLRIERVILNGQEVSECLTRRDGQQDSLFC
jgi:N-acetylglucosamine-6-phosphate deacetylase